MDQMEALKYPIGVFDFNKDVLDEQIPERIKDIEETPGALRKSLAGLTEEQLDVPYRPGGWTIRQVVHHIADSHLNSYIRFRLALTEEKPTIKPYDEGKWAELTDARTMPVEISLSILEGLHLRWVTLLKSLGEADMQRALIHPESGILTVSKMIGLYAWHGRHHITHITNLRSRNNW